MTTDTVPKAASPTLQLGGRTVTVTGISKGAGMIHPNMATMLGFVATDAAIEPALMQRLVREAADESFNRITIDGDTSTNDSFVLIATQRAGNAPIDEPRQRRRPGSCAKRSSTSRAGSRRRSSATARARPSSSPSASKAAPASTSAARSRTRSATRRWSRPRSSPAIRTSAASSRPSAMPASTTSTRPGSTSSSTTCTSSKAAAAAPSYREEDGQRVMKQSEITVRVDLHRGSARGDGLDLRPELRLRQDQRRLPELMARRLRPHHGVQQPGRPGRGDEVLQGVAAQAAERDEHRPVRPSRTAWPRRSSRAPPTRPGPAWPSASSPSRPSPRPSGTSSIGRNWTNR